MPSSLLSRLTVSARRAGGTSSEVGPVSLRGSEPSPAARSLRVSRPPPAVAVEPQPPEALIEVIARNPTETIAIVGDCLIVRIGRTMSASGVHAVQRGCEELRVRYGRFGYLSVIAGYRLGELEPKARVLMGEVIGKYARNMAVAAFAVAGSGFRATAVRSILTAVHFASRAKHPMKVFAELDGALEWYAAAYPEHRCDITTLARSVEALGAPAEWPPRSLR
jgi:hypothetical protein